MLRFRPPDMRHVPLPILHAEASFVVVDKPPDLLSVPGRDPSLWDSVVTRIPQLFPHATGPICVHRLDMATSGIMVAALTRDAQRHLSMQFEARSVEKTYIALCEGRVEPEYGTIEFPMRVDIHNRPLQIFDPLHGKPSCTHFRVLCHEGANTRLLFMPHTGRTHQLRLHAAHELGLGHPIVGDRLYGNPALCERLLLHAESIEFNHPETSQRLRFVSPVPF